LLISIPILKYNQSPEKKKNFGQNPLTAVAYSVISIYV
jgi:hypothetical protein